MLWIHLQRLPASGFARFEITGAAQTLRLGDLARRQFLLIFTLSFSEQDTLPQIQMIIQVWGRDL